MALHQFGADRRLVFNGSGAGVIGTGPYVFEDGLLKFQDATGVCAGLIGLYEVYGIYEEHELVRLRFAMDGMDPCTDRKKTLDGKIQAHDESHISRSRFTSGWSRSSGSTRLFIRSRVNHEHTP